MSRMVQPGAAQRDLPDLAALRALVEAAQDPMAALDRAGRLLASNAAFRRWMRQSIGLELADGTDGCDLVEIGRRDAAMLDAWSRALHGERVVAEHAAPGGTFRAVYAPVPGGAAEPQDGREPAAATCVARWAGEPHGEAAAGPEERAHRASSDGWSAVGGAAVRRPGPQHRAAAVEAAGLGTWEYDARAQLAYLDARAGETLGIPGRAILRPDEAAALAHPEDRERLLALVREAASGGGGEVRAEFRLAAEAGPAERWVRLLGRAAGGAGRFAGVVLDVTEDRRRERALRESEARYRGVLAAARDAIFIFPAEPDGTPLPFVEVNDEACRRLGYTREQLLGMTVYDLVSRDPADVRRKVLEVLGGSSLAVEVTHIASDGREIPTEIIGSAVSIDGRRCVLAICRDITAGRQVEEVARRSEERLRLALAAGGMGTWSWDLASGRIVLDDRQRELLGFAPGVFGGTIEEVLERIHPDDREAERSTAGRAMRGEATESTFRVVRPDGEVRWLTTVTAPVMGPSGRAEQLIGVNVDVTEQRLREEELRASDERYRTIGDSIAFGVWTCSAEGRCTYVSRSLLRTLGMTLEEVQAHGWRGRLPPEEVAPTREKWRKTIREGGNWEHEHRFRAADGSWRTILSLGRPVRDAEGRILEWVGLNLDITERKRVEESLRTAERRQGELLELLESLLANAPIGFAFFDRAHRFIRVNRQLAEINGVSVQEHLDRPIEEVVPGMTKVKGPLIDRVFLTGQPLEGLELSGETPAHPGERRWWLASLYPVFAGHDEPSFVGCVLLEITDRKRAEGALRESRDRLAAALEASETGTFRYDFNEGSASWDEELIRLFGIRPDDVPSSIDQEVLLSCVHPDDRPAVRAEVQRRLSGACDSEIEYRVRLPDGGVRWLLDKGATVADEHGRPVFLTGACTDITERKRAEERQRVLLAELSHRVKNTLATVQSIATQTALSAESTAAFRRSFTGRLRALAGLHSLLTRSNWDGVAIDELVREALRPYASDGGENADIEGPPVTLSAKAAQTVSMMLHELATNAAKYGALSNPAGRISVRWSLADANGQELTLAWAETGGPPVREPERRGFGSGLIEHQVAYELGGEVRLEFPEEGVRCTIRVPAREALAEPPPPRRSRSGEPSPPPHR